MARSFHSSDSTKQIASRSATDKFVHRGPVRTALANQREASNKLVFRSYKSAKPSVFERKTLRVDAERPSPVVKKLIGRNTSLGSSEIMLIMVLLLLSSLIAARSQQSQASTLLLQNQVLALKASQDARNRAIAADIPTAERSEGTRALCSAGRAQAGSIVRDAFRCHYFPPAKAPGSLLLGYDKLFSPALPCPIRSRDSVAPSEWSRRSLYECTRVNEPAPTTLILAGDLLLTKPLKLLPDQENLLATRGSISIPELIATSDTTIITLGDLSIRAISNDSGKPLHLILAAPLGVASVATADRSISLSVISKEDRVSPLLPRRPVRPSLYISPRSSLSLGIFPQDLGVAP